MARKYGRILLGTSIAIALAAGAYGVAAIAGGGAAGVSRGFIGVAEFGAWRLICVPAPAMLDGLVPGAAKAPAPAGANACRINQEVLGGATPGQVVLAANFSLVGVRRSPALLLRLPANARTGAGVGLRLDNARDVKAAVRDCAGGQCIAAGNLSAEDWRGLLAAKTVQVRFATADGQMVLVDLKESGLSARPPR